MSEPQVHEPPEKPRVRVWLRLFVAGGALVALLVVFGLVWSQVQGAREREEKMRLEQTLDEKDPNWRLADLEEAREQIPENENSARVVVAVVGMLPRDWPQQAFFERFTDQPSQEQLNVSQAQALDAEMRAQSAAVLQARRLADMPRGRHRLKWAFMTIGTILQDQQETRKVGQLLSFDAMNRAQQGDYDGALRSSRALINAGRSLGDEPILISALIRTALIAMGGSSVERVLAQGVAGDAELTRLQELLALEDAHPTLRIALRGERASAYDMLTKMADGRVSTREMDGLMSGPEGPGWAQRLWAGRVGRREPVIALRLLTKAVDAADLPEAEQSAAEAEYEREVKALGSDARYVRLLLPALGNASRAIRRKSAYVRCLMALVAVERYRLANKKWPDTLADLKPKLLKDVPTDPFDGKPLRYKKVADGVLVYSCGEDGIDDGGNVNRLKPNAKGVDVGYWLWDEAKRRQPSSKAAEGEEKKP